MTTDKAQEMVLTMAMMIKEKYPDMTDTEAGQAAKDFFFTTMNSLIK